MKNLLKLSILLCLVLAFIGCKDRETQFTYYDDAKTKPKEVFEVDKETGKKDGKYKEFYKNGQVKTEAQYKDGNGDGPYKEYYENGQVSKETQYKEGYAEGPYKEYYKNGQVKKEVLYKGGKADGTYKEYYENGQVCMDIVFKDGLRKVKFRALSKIDNVMNKEMKKYIIDPRDGQEYRIIKIGTQTWMAENLNYLTPDSYCFGDEPSNCTEYGRLYTWDAAMNACPSGWHLPSDGEFEILLKFVGGVQDRRKHWIGAGEKLKSAIGWDICFKDVRNGTDAFFFSALPVGCRGLVGRRYTSEGTSTIFWSSTEFGSSVADFMRLGSGNDDVYLSRDLKNLGYSVRCLKD